MEHTEYYQLSLWEQDDRIQMEDFNADNAKIDAALAAAAGNCKIATGSYTGAGTYGSGGKNTLTFDFAPQLVILHSTNGQFTILRRDIGAAFIGADNYGYWLNVSWSENSVSWYNSSDARQQFNQQNYRYFYTAIY